MISGPRTFERSAKRTTISASSRKADHEEGKVALNELDTAADTCCAGINHRALSFTGQTCEVNGFKDGMSISDIPVAQTATAFIDEETGITYILIFNEVLYFGSMMDHSLINPNQCRAFEISISDNPYDKSRVLGIDHDDVFVPFETKGSKVCFKTSVPTDYQLNNCPHIIMTDDKEWDPQGIDMGHDRSRKDPDIGNLLSVKSISKKREREEYLGITGETDMILGSVCESLVPGRLVQNMISAVKVRDIKPKKKEKVARGRRTMNKVMANSRHSIITAEHIARTFNVGLNKANETLKATTQKGIRTANYPLTRRYRVDHLHLKRNYLNGKWCVDWMPSSVKSITQCKGAFVYSNGTYAEIYPKEDNTQVSAAATLQDFCRDVGVPETLKSDRAQEFCGRDSEFKKLTRKKGIDMSYAEPGREGQVYRVDISIRELKKRWHQKMTSKNVPKRLWDFGIRHAAHVMQVLPSRSLNNRTPYEVVHGHTPDISELVDFDFYDLVWVYDKKHPGVSEEDKILCRWLGVAHDVGSDMCYWVMPESGIALARTTVQHVTRDDMLDPAINEQIIKFNEALTTRLDDTNFKIKLDEVVFDDYRDDLPQWDAWDPAYGDEKTTPTHDEYDNMILEERKDMDEYDDDTYDGLIGASFRLDESSNNGGNLATVTRRVTDDNGNMVGKAHPNPLLSTAEYEVTLEDGTTDKYFANVICENIYSQLDSEGKENLVMNEIVDHRKDGTAIEKDNGYTGTGSNRKPRKTTKGWQLLIEWKDESTTWVDLKDVKEANPIELAEYAVANKIDEEPAFQWWVPYTLKKRNRVISKTKSKYWKTTHKYGIRIPKTLEEAIQIDTLNGNRYWQNAVDKEMKKAKVAYTPREGITPEDVRSNKVDDMRGYQEIKCHLVFDVKMDFTRKARYVAGGHTTSTPIGLTYSSVVSRDSVRLAFLIAALNDLKVGSCDIGNAYLNAPCKEKIWFVAGAECGEHRGKVMILERALYGLKSSGASWRSMFKEFIENHLGFVSTRADPDAYIRKNRKSNITKEGALDGAGSNGVANNALDGDSGEYYYEILLVYVDDVLLVSHNPDATMDVIGLAFEIKDGEKGPPKRYLGAETELFTNCEGKQVWSMKCDQYVDAAVDIVKDLLKEDGRDLKSGPRKHKGPLPPQYKPELDVTDECDAEHTSRFQQLIGILRWAIELGRIDIMVEVAMMSSYQASPREGHLEALYLIFHYLSKNPKKRMVLDPYRPAINEAAFNLNADWTEFYGYAEEQDPPNMPEPLGEPVITSCFVDADHAGNVVTRRSHTGILLFVNNALIKAYSKRQNTVESSTFGSELVAMRIARDMIVELRIKLKCFGVPLEGPTNVMCDNNGVVKNTSIPESTLSKKHNSINYHVVREAAAAGILRVGKEDTKTNLADALTKLLPYSRKMDLLGGLLYDY